MDTNNTERLAGSFVAVLRRWLTAEQWAEMRERNATEPSDSTCCHSHDFVDANMAMLEAFQATFNREPDVSEGPDVELWNAAWKVAFTGELGGQQ